MVSELMSSSRDFRISARGCMAELEYISGVMPENRVLKSLEDRNILRTRIEGGEKEDLHDVYAFIHLHVFIENLVPIPVDDGHPSDAHPSRCVNHLTIQGQGFECFI